MYTGPFKYTVRVRVLLYCQLHKNNLPDCASENVLRARCRCLCHSIYIDAISYLVPGVHRVGTSLTLTNQANCVKNFGYHVPRRVGDVWPLRTFNYNTSRYMFFPINLHFTSIPGIVQFSPVKSAVQLQKYVPNLSIHSPLFLQGATPSSRSQSFISVFNERGVAMTLECAYLSSHLKQ